MTFREWAWEHAEDLEVGCGRYKDMQAAWRAGQEEMRGRAAEVCREIEGNLGDEHHEACDSVTVIEDECDCYLAVFRGSIRALPLEGDNE